MPQFLPQDRQLAGASRWFETPLGQAVLDLEQEAAAALLERVFGFDAVSLDIGWPGKSLLANCPIHRKLSIGPGEAANLRCDLEAVPLSSASVDAVVLPHTLEFVESPHVLLREADRVLVGEGHMLVLGFNPRSSWNVRRLMNRRVFPEQGVPISEPRMRDWLALLGFEVVDVRRYFRRLPVNHAGFLERTNFIERPGWLPLPSAGYALLARKHLHGLTPLRPAEVHRHRVAGGGAEPVARLDYREWLSARPWRNPETAIPGTQYTEKAEEGQTSR